MNNYKFNATVMNKLAVNDVYIKKLIKDLGPEVAFNTTILSDKVSDNGYKDKYLKIYKEMGFDDNFEFKEGKYLTNGGGTGGDISSGKFCYCSSMKYGGNYKFIYIHIIKDLKYGKLKISSLKTLISKISDFFGFLKTDKNLEVIFLAEFSGKTYNNTKELFTAINNSIDKALKNKGKKIPETPKGYF